MTSNDKYKWASAPVSPVCNDGHQLYQRYIALGMLAEYIP